MRKITIIAALAALCALSCEPLEQSPAGDSSQEMVRVSVRASQGTKSAMQISETAVSNINVYAYRGGQLETESFAEDDEIELLLVRNAAYRIYALANCGEIHAPMLESDLSTISVTPSDMVMCFREGRQMVAGASQTPLELPLTRLFARYILRLDNNLEKCDYQITSVEVLQQAAAVRPFAAASAAASTIRGDTATAADLTALNNGRSAVFYIPENCQGVLLPGNSDPWEKVPSNIPAAKRTLCTYLHIEGEWTTGGAVADLSFNLMLGADNCTDFNVTRNSSVTITLSLSDSGTCRSSWKVDMDNLDDDRVLAFSNSQQVLMQESGWTQIPLTVSPPDLSYSVSLTGPDEPVMEAKVENGRVYVRGIYYGDLRPTSTLTVTSWDGRVSASILLTLSYQMGAFENYSYLRPDYPGQYGYLQLTNVSESDPVRVETGQWNTTIAGYKSASENIEYHYDAQNHVEYYVAHNQRIVYIRMLQAGGATTYVQMTQHHTRTKLLMSGVVNPGLAIDDSFVSEAGNRQYSGLHSLYYDTVTPVYLLGKNGARLDLESFKIPLALLTYKNKSSSQQDRVSDFLDLYGAPSISGGGANYGFLNATIAGVGCEEIAQSGNLASVYLYGLTDFGTSNPTYAINASLTMASGVVISASGTITGKPAFPSQRYLGSVYNYQIAPGSLRNSSSSIDFTSGGDYLDPTFNNVTWSIVHIDGGACDNPSAAYSAGTADKYSTGASVSGSSLSFSEISSTVFPACGALGLRGTVTNPHSGRSYTGYYSLSLILYLSVGCSVVFENSKMYVNFKPFCDYALQSDIYSSWSGGFPLSIGVISEFNSSAYQIWVPSINRIGVLSISGIPAPGSLQSLIGTLSSDMSRFRFSFTVNEYTSGSLLLDRSATDLSENKGWKADGSKGYYYLVRQYDVGNMSVGKYNGLENYILEAAMDTYVF
ncbi:MAG: DUF4906 domain-containing protein [Bacteroidales bacterium]|nr:DUF4906 domain-containing protein [Bacteroidales bacterium]